jgi:hypothetical protein
MEAGLQHKVGHAGPGRHIHEDEPGGAAYDRPPATAGPFARKGTLEIKT